MTSFAEMFGSDDTSPFYPGSKQRKDAARASVLVAPDVVGPFDGVKPRIYQVRGVETEFFTVGQVAAALSRKPGTFRKWEADGVVPKATFQAPNPKKDPRARRRLYTRAQAEGIVRIAREEGLINDSRRAIGATRFTERVVALFRELQAQ